jgi:hypothetical protein
LVTQVRNIRLVEPDDTVAVGVPFGHVDHVDFFSVEVQGERMIKGNNRQSFLGNSRIFLIRQALADVAMGDDRGLAAEMGVSSGVIPVPMGVQNELQVSLIQVVQGGLDLFGQGRELIVDDQQTVRTDGDPDVAAGPFEHMDLAAHMGGFDFDIIEVTLGVGCIGPREKQTGRQTKCK